MGLDDGQYWLLTECTEYQGAVEKVPPASESPRCAEILVFHYYKCPSFFLSLYFGPRPDGPH